MGISGGPDIIQDGLVLSLDASDLNSYVSGSSTWFDLSGNNRNFTIVNSTTFGGNYIELPGSGSSIRLVENFDWSIIPFTLSSWINMTDQTYPSIYDLILAGNGHLSLNASSTRFASKKSHVFRYDFCLNLVRLASMLVCRQIVQPTSS